MTNSEKPDLRVVAKDDATTAGSRPRRSFSADHSDPEGESTDAAPNTVGDGRSDSLDDSVAPGAAGRKKFDISEIENLVRGAPGRDSRSAGGPTSAEPNSTAMPGMQPAEGSGAQKLVT